jgi:hypothetical protein
MLRQIGMLYLDGSSCLLSNEMILGVKFSTDKNR